MWGRGLIIAGAGYVGSIPQVHAKVTNMAKQRAENIFRETWFDGTGKRLVLTCDDSSCLVELTMFYDAANRGKIPVSVEILQQARDARGQAAGPTVVIHRQRASLECLPRSQRSIARFWLPSSLVSPHIRNCYFRVV